MNSPKALLVRYARHCKSWQEELAPKKWQGRLYLEDGFTHWCEIVVPAPPEGRE